VFSILIVTLNVEIPRFQSSTRMPVCRPFISLRFLSSAANSAGSQPEHAEVSKHLHAEGKSHPHLMDFNCVETRQYIRHNSPARPTTCQRTLPMKPVVGEGTRIRGNTHPTGLPLTSNLHPVPCTKCGRRTCWSLTQQASAIDHGILSSARC